MVIPVKLPLLLLSMRHPKQDEGGCCIVRIRMSKMIDFRIIARLPLLLLSARHLTKDEGGAA